MGKRDSGGNAIVEIVGFACFALAIVAVLDALRRPHRADTWRIGKLPPEQPRLPRYTAIRCSGIPVVGCWRKCPFLSRKAVFGSATPSGRWIWLMRRSPVSGGNPGHG